VREDLKEELGLLELEKKSQELFERALVELNSTKGRLDSLQDQFSQASSPILLTEGKSDPIILEHAWSRIFPAQSRNFRIIPCTTFDDGKESSGGTGILKKALESCRTDQPITVGLFDRDEKGIKSFNNLDKNFLVYRKTADIKMHKNRNAAAFLIPNILAKKDYIDVDNLPIEFLFPEDYIVKQHNGYGLELCQEKIFKLIGNKRIEDKETTEPIYRKVIGNKTYYAEKVIPTFPNDAFLNFKDVFECFLLILRELKK